MSSSNTHVLRRGFRHRISLGIIALLALAAMLAATSHAAQAAVSFDVKGQWLCDNRGTVSPVAGARVELWQNNSFWFDDKLGSTHIGSNGSFDFGVRADDNFNLYVKLVLDDDQGVNLGEWYSFSPWDTQTDSTDSHSGTVDLGTWQISNNDGKGTPLCAIWQGAHNAYGNYKQVIGSPPPDSNYSIDADFPCCGYPFTTTDTTHWPSGYQTSDNPTTDLDGGYNVNYHEFAHSVRHSFDGSFAHFLGDVISYDYAQSHDFCKVTNEGFAFNEGWAEYWAKTPHSCPDPTNLSQEGNVAANLKSLEACSSRATMVRVLKNNPGTIHSYTQYKSRWDAVVGPRGCLLHTITGNLGFQGSLSTDELVSREQQQIRAQQGLVDKLASTSSRVRRRALPRSCATGTCTAVLQTVAAPSAASVRLAQAKLVLVAEQAGLAAAQKSGFNPDFGKISYYQTLAGQQRAFERANQATVIAGLKQVTGAVADNPGLARARATHGFRRLRQTLGTVSSEKARRRPFAKALASQFSAPDASGDATTRNSDLRPITLPPRPPTIRVRVR